MPTDDAAWLGDDLVAFVPRVIARRLAQRPMPIPVPSAEHAHGACLFVDIAGFTPLTEALAAQGARGAEQMADVLDQYFGALVDASAAHGGEIVDFAGDALLIAWWCEPDQLREAAARAVACALHLQDVVTRQAAQAPVEISVKITAAAGAITVLHVGGVDDRKRCVVTGEPVAELSGLADRARPSEVLVTDGVAQLLRGQLHTDPRHGDAIRVVGIDAPPPPVALAAARVPEGAEAALREYVPHALDVRFDAGGPAWVAEFRQVTSVFVRLVGLELDGFGAADTLGELIAAIQVVIHRFDGSLHQLIDGDKGLVLLAAFGMPPRAHEDDPARGVQAALAIEEVVAEHGLRSAIGITTGMAFCGPVGGTTRRDFALVGDTVNLAARLMQRGLDDVLCDAATASSYDRIEYDQLDTTEVKGRAASVEVFRPRGDVPRTVRRRAEAHPMVGRGPERARIRRCLDEVAAGTGGLLVIEGDAGMGKTRLVEDLLRQADERGLRLLAGAGNALEVSTPYLAWRPVLAGAIGLDQAPSNPGARRRHVLRWLGQHLDVSSDTALLGAPLGVPLPGDVDALALSPAERATRTRDLLARVLAVVSDQAPLVVVIEDAHWIDSASWALTLDVSRRLPRALTVVASRPVLEQTPTQQELFDEAVRVRLQPLSDAETVELVKQRLDIDTVPPALRDLLERAEGHPFFSEELLRALVEDGVVTVEGATAHVVAEAMSGTGPVPDTVQGVVRSRIDRLSPRGQLVAKTASVIGRDFDLDTVAEVFPVAGTRMQVRDDLEELQRRGLVNQRSDGAGGHYTFAHAIVRDVAYEALPYVQRRNLHRSVALAMESAAPERQNHALLGHHWLQAAGDDDAEALGSASSHLTAAGVSSLRQGGFAEAEQLLTTALTCYERLPADDQDPVRELAILAPLGTATFTTKGFGASESLAVFERADALAAGRVPAEDHFPILWGLWLTSHFSFATDRAIELGERLMRMSEDVGSAELRLQAHHALWTTLIQVPDYARAERHLRAGSQLYQRAWHARHCAEFGGHDPGSCARRAQALLEWTTGRPDHAVASGTAAIELAQDHTFSRLNAMLALAFVHRQRGDLDAAAAQADAVIELATQRRLPGWIDWAALIRHWVEGRRGDRDAAIAAMEEVTSRIGLTDPGYLTMPAELLLDAGRTDEGLELVDELFTVADRKHEHSYTPELHRLRGELILGRSGGGADPEGIDQLRRALILAEQQGARSFALRAAISLSRVAPGPAHDEGVAALHRILDLFDEGHETVDLQEAAALLASSR